MIVIALGGNALLQPHEELSAANLIKNARIAAQQIAKISATEKIVLVHGNGPQVGLLALQSEAYTSVPAYPFDILAAESQGMIGYVLQQALLNEAPDKTIATLLTQVLVEASDTAFSNPTKPIGPFYSEARYQQLKLQYPNYYYQRTSDGFRRIVASPQPKNIIELNSIQQLLMSHDIVIAGGGGGIPCIQSDQDLIGVEAVIDKDLTASLMACQLEASQLIILTNVAAVYKNWQQPNATAINSVTVEELSQLQFAAGSMQPKIDAACQFVKQTKASAAIGHLAELDQIIHGTAGTHIKF